MRNLQRSIPYLSVHDGVRHQLQPGRRRSKRVCLTTGRGRSVTRLTRRSRLAFRQLAFHGLYGLQPSSW